jgi:hypothetical protein
VLAYGRRAWTDLADVTSYLHAGTHCLHRSWRDFPHSTPILRPETQACGIHLVGGTSYTLDPVALPSAELREMQTYYATCHVRKKLMSCSNNHMYFVLLHRESNPGPLARARGESVDHLAIGEELAEKVCCIIPNSAKCRKRENVKKCDVTSVNCDICYVPPTRRVLCGRATPAEILGF